MGLALHETARQLFSKSRLMGKVPQSKQEQHQSLFYSFFLPSGGQSRLNFVAGIFDELQVGPLLQSQVLDG